MWPTGSHGEEVAFMVNQLPYVAFIILGRMDCTIWIHFWKICVKGGGTTSGDGAIGAWSTITEPTTSKIDSIGWIGRSIALSEYIAS